MPAAVMPEPVLAKPIDARIAIPATVAAVHLPVLKDEVKIPSGIASTQRTTCVHAVC